MPPPGLRRSGLLDRLDLGDEVLERRVGDELVVDRLHRVDEGLLLDRVDHRAAGLDLGLGGLFAGVPELAHLGDGLLGGDLDDLLVFLGELVEAALRHHQHLRRQRVLGQRVELRDLVVLGRFEGRPVVLGAVDDAGLQAGIDLAEGHRRGVGAERRDQATNMSDCWTRIFRPFMSAGVLIGRLEL